MVELLAPARNKDTAFAAIDCGADAVYIGATDFGARKNASNSIEDIKSVVEYAHKFWVKVYVTINTILTDSELNNAVNLALKLQDINVDALIIQDMGLLKKLSENKDFYLPLHISTQCDNSSLEKVKFFNDIGIKRVVLARETSIEQMKKIHKANPNLKLESFIHGALCVSYSGQCYLSQFIGGRSANRGECAQPCRKKYTVETTDGKIIKKDFYALCLKDFNASNCIDELIDAGITSFKIEGRLKDINYVKNIVSYYAQKLKNKSSSGKSLYTFTPNPEKSFNRGFTEYFLKERTDCFNMISPKSRGEFLGKVIEIKENCFKIEPTSEIRPQDGLCFEDEGFLVNKIENNYIYPNKKLSLKKGTKIYRNADVEFEKQLTQKVKRQIGIKVTVINNKLTITDENGIKFEQSIQGEKPQNQEKAQDNFIKQFSKTGESDFYIQNIDVKNVDFMPVSKINELRRTIFENLMNKRIECYNSRKSKEKTKIKYVPYIEKEVDYRANVHNKEAKAFYENCSCKVLEPSLETKSPNRQVSLMRTKHCIKYALNMCKSPQNLVLRDDHNNIYPLKFDCKKCEMSVLSNT